MTCRRYLNFACNHSCIPAKKKKKKKTVVPSFLACGELSGWLGNQAVRCKQWKICNQFLIFSSLAGAFMHLLNGR